MIADVSLIFKQPGMSPSGTSRTSRARKGAWTAAISRSTTDRRRPLPPFVPRRGRKIQSSLDAGLFGQQRALIELRRVARSEDGTMASDIQRDIESVQRIDAVPKILDVICKTTGMGFAAVARVTEDRWVCCAVRDDIQFGLLPGRELPLETTICHEIRQSHRAVVIDHVAEDAVFSGHHTPAKYGFQSISMPIFLVDGGMFGTLCALDPRPARLNTPETIGTFQLFAELIGTHLDAMDHYVATSTQLMDERKSSELREQFIAVLGHDLRNPLAALSSGARLLRKAKSTDDATKIESMMQDSVNRMANLIDNVMDFARGRLGDGIILNRTANEPQEPLLAQVIAELQSTHPDRAIEVDIKIDKPVDCDGARIAQMFSNLLGNAITHGDAARPIVVHAATYPNSFELFISNSGRKISDEAMKHLFQPFYCGSIQPSMQGLGLGLYIASEIAKAHGGALDVISTDEEIRFTFLMPLRH
jgi:signal transduction histidine kinase